jgi:hypothetical protein
MFDSGQMHGDGERPDLSHCSEDRELATRATASGPNAPTAVEPAGQNAARPAAGAARLERKNVKPILVA